jgi:hypothetical protein
MSIMSSKEILYHASNVEFDTFKRFGDRLPSMGLGHYLTPSIDKANQYGSIIMAFEVDTSRCLDWANLTPSQRTDIEHALLKVVPDERIAHYGKPCYEIVPRNKQGQERFREIQAITKNAYNDSAKAKIILGKNIPENIRNSIQTNQDLSDKAVVKWKTADGLKHAPNQQLMTLMQEFQPELAKRLGYQSARFSDEIVIYSPTLANKIGRVYPHGHQANVSATSPTTKKQTVSISDYYNTDGARDLAHKAKKGDTEACLQIAKQLVDKLSFPGDTVFVPVPSSSGRATNNLIVCNEMARLTGANVSDCLTGPSRAALYEIKQKGVTPSDNYLSFKATNPPATGNVFLFDIVTDSGITMAAAKAALGMHTNTKMLSHSKVGLDIERENKRQLEGYMVPS